MVFVLDKRKRPLMPCTERRARLLLSRGRAVVHKMYPFTIRLKDRDDGERQPIRVKIDPGAETTGMAVVREQGRDQTVLHLAELEHRGWVIRKRLTARALRRYQRRRSLRYRPYHVYNRTKPKGWIAPSLRARVDNIASWVSRYRRLAPLTAISVESVKFDSQRLQNPTIDGVDYQQGELYKRELREYLLEKWGRKCAYCGKDGVPLQKEHIVPKSKGGSDRVSNLTLACGPCNQKKAGRSAAEFLKNKPEVLARVLARCKVPLAASAAVNITRNALLRSLKVFNLPLEPASGGWTRWNRERFGVPKEHALDAACVGGVDSLGGWDRPVLAIKAVGRGAYQRTRTDAYGFPRSYMKKVKSVNGFATGDMARAIVPSGKNTGTHTGRVAIRSDGYFDIINASGKRQGINSKHFSLISRADGYSYTIERRERLLPAARVETIDPCKEAV